MQTWVGIIRTESDLEKGLAAIEDLKKRVGKIKVEDNRHFNAAWHEAFDMRNMMIVAEAMCRGALTRKESRGGHAREDFPEMDKHFGGVNIVSKNDGGAMKTDEVPLPEVPEEIKKILEEKE